MVIKIKVHQTVSAPSHQKTCGFLRKKKKKKKETVTHALISFTKFYEDAKVQLVLRVYNTNSWIIDATLFKGAENLWKSLLLF